MDSSRILSIDVRRSFPLIASLLQNAWGVSLTRILISQAGERSNTALRREHHDFLRNDFVLWIKVNCRSRMTLAAHGRCLS